MAKHRKPKQSSAKGNEQVTLSDALGDDILQKLQAAKKELSAIEAQQEQERQEKLRRERKEREKNKSFAELLDEYGNHGSKY
ncbi:YqkE family protein [Sporosarcina sp. HYO08]|uniref:YqkE family protein n=1 Tax=Sporosarcina sp. HYO08 TaxID=1759557 RepID=UPI00079409A2|nr:YqkE family protein [Sporosarcina sp. HYO08]KXH80073.1 hypothetical protein AU377_11405 [Sporosarcina sp. HYO08]